MTRASLADNVRGAARSPYHSMLPELLLNIVSQICRPEIEQADMLAQLIAEVLDRKAEPEGEDAGVAHNPVCRVE